jgi:hypothetical protein|tara:strand:+ start:307 stop:492 length:186 start_codon:yes stop_codon:yes gene_type:complete
MMVTFPQGITDEEIETLSEQAQEEVDTALHDLAVKRKKLIEAGVPEEDKEIRELDALIEVI